MLYLKALTIILSFGQENLAALRVVEFGVLFQCAFMCIIQSKKYLHRFNELRSQWKKYYCGCCMFGYLYLKIFFHFYNFFKIFQTLVVICNFLACNQVFSVVYSLCKWVMLNYLVLIKKIIFVSSTSGILHVYWGIHLFFLK